MYQSGDKTYQECYLHKLQLEERKERRRASESVICEGAEVDWGN
jgi:hypothetical protein